MALDICPELPAPPDEVREATERTHLWAARAAAAMDAARRDGSAGGQALFLHLPGRHRPPRLRRASAETLASIGFDGYGIGGLSVGESRREMGPALHAATDVLPADRPRYLMGRRRPGTHRRRHRGRSGHVRLRPAEPARPPRHRAHAPGSHQHSQRPIRPRRHAARPRRASARRAPSARRPLQPRLPPAPDERERADGQSHPDAAQHRVSQATWWPTHAPPSKPAGSQRFESRSTKSGTEPLPAVAARYAAPPSDDTLRSTSWVRSSSSSHCSPSCISS